MSNELIAPITEDFRQPDNRMDIIKGLEKINTTDVTLGAGFSPEMGDWGVKSNGTLVALGVTAVPNAFPVWVGSDSLDSVVTKQATIIVGGGFIYRTTKFVAGSYADGMNLTAKGAGLQAAVGQDPIHARVFTAPDSKGVMEIQVLDR